MVAWRSYWFKLTSLLVLGLGLASLGLGLRVLEKNTRALALSRLESSQVPKKGRAHQPPLPFNILSFETRERAKLYHRAILKSHLVHGMVVNRSHSGEVLDTCDSLLFSALRYVSLTKLGYTQAANKAWQALSLSQKEGEWYRHPDCKKGATSRDMILGFLLALSQNPPQSVTHLQQFFKYLKNNKGFFGQGPLYLSYLSPGLAENFRRLSLFYGLHDLPLTLEAGFSTVEFSALGLKKGYQSHLVALQVWWELEMSSQRPLLAPLVAARSLLEPASVLLSPFTATSPYELRLRWVAAQLENSDRHNLFFRWLNARTQGKLSRQQRSELLAELVQMRQFPASRLPEDCDRRADYLWQRDSREFRPRSSECTLQFNGVDFLWMAGLLLGEKP